MREKLGLFAAPVKATPRRSSLHGKYCGILAVVRKYLSILPLDSQITNKNIPVDTRDNYTLRHDLQGNNLGTAMNTAKKKTAGMPAYDRLTLARLRERLGVQQKLVASRMGVNSSVISRLESGDNPMLASLEAFVEALGGELHLVAAIPRPDGGVDLSFIRTPGDPRRFVEKEALGQVQRPVRELRMAKLDKMIAEAEACDV